MKRIRIFAILIVLTTISVLSSDAFARARMYHSSLGRFTQLDPIGTNYAPLRADSSQPSAIRNLSAARFAQRDTAPQIARSVTTRDIVDKAYVSAHQKVIQRLGNITVVSNPHLLQYADGANLYQYVGSNPVLGTDPSGLDRYLVDKVHAYILVDQWEWNKKKCCWVKLPWKQRYDFSANYNWGPGFLLCAVYGPGLIRTSRSSLPGSDVKTLTSMPWEDMKMEIELTLEMADPPGYSLTMFNCSHWSYHNINRGYGAPAPKEPYRQKVCRD